MFTLCFASFAIVEIGNPQIHTKSTNTKVFNFPIEEKANKLTVQKRKMPQDLQ